MSGIAVYANPTDLSSTYSKIDILSTISARTFDEIKI